MVDTNKKRKVMADMNFLKLGQISPAGLIMAGLAVTMAIPSWRKGLRIGLVFVAGTVLAIADKIGSMDKEMGKMMEDAKAVTGDIENLGHDAVRLYKESEEILGKT
jgi:hypothetical protein